VTDLQLAEQVSPVMQRRKWVETFHWNAGEASSAAAPSSAAAQNKDMDQHLN